MSENDIPFRQDKDLYKPLPLMEDDERYFESFVYREAALQLALDELTKRDGLLHSLSRTGDRRWKFPFVAARGGPRTGKVLNKFATNCT
jgi:hypothetical protein